MSAHEAYDRLMPDILGISPDSIQHPNQPAENIVVEGKKNIKLTVEDREALLNSGIDAEILDGLQDRVEAYEISEAKYIVLRDSTEDLKEKLKIIRDKTFEIRKVLLHNLNFVLKNDKDAVAALERIAHGRSINNKIFDIRPILELAGTHLADLDKINFDRSILDDAEILYNEAQEVQSEIAVSPKAISEIKEIRNRAYTYLNEALSKIKEHAHFVFWQNEERLNLYKNQYRITRKYKKSNSDDTNLELEPLDIEKQA